MSYYRTNVNDDEGLFINTDDCINTILRFQPIIQYNYQRPHQIRGKGFYKIVSENKTYYLVTLDTLFEMIYGEHNRSTLKEIKVSGKNPNVHYVFNKKQTFQNDWLVGFEETTDGLKSYHTMSFREIPENVLYCYRNIN